MSPADRERIQETLAAFKSGDWSLGMELLLRLEESTEGTNHLEHAKNALHLAYIEARNAIVSAFIQEWRDGDFSGSRDAAIESLEQSCGNACTYTHTAQCYLTASQYDDAYLDEFGELPNTKEGIPWETLAAYALRADCLKCIKSEGIDINDDPPSEKTEECKGCDEWKVCENGVCEDCTVPEDDDDADQDSEGAGAEPDPVSK